MKHLLLLFALALPALGQMTVTTVSTMADLLALTPVPARPHVRVLGGAVINDGAGGDYVWVAASTAATNAVNSIASPYGAAAGRWLKLVQGAPMLDDATLLGVTTVPSGAGIALQAGSGFAAASGAPVTIDTLVISKAYSSATGFEPVRKGDFEQAIIPLVANLAALRNLPIPGGAGFTPSVFRRATVLANTVTSGIADGAKGDWYWDASSTLTESPVVQKSNLLPGSDPGRWLKL